ncbi:MAG: sulfatase activating formylglycine-generating enzyme [Planctomycetota bacterium]
MLVAACGSHVATGPGRLPVSPFDEDDTMKIFARLNSLGFSLLVLTCTVALGSVGLASQLDRSPVPTIELRKEALEELKAAFRAKYKSHDLDSRRMLAAELVNVSERYREDALPDYYAYLDEARKIAMEVQAIETGFAAIDRMGGAFEVDGRTLKVRFVDRIADDVLAEERCAVLSEALPLIEECVELEEYGAAVDLLKSLGAFAGSCEDDYVQRTLAAASYVCDEFEKIERQLGKLEDNPDDASANDRVGQFYCFVRADFATGLPLLEKSGSKKLRLLAAADVAMGESFEEQLLLGEKWLNHAERSKKGNARALSASRAAFWFERSLNGLTAERSKLKAEQHLETALALSVKAPIPMPKPAARTGLASASAGKSGGVRTPAWAELQRATPDSRVVRDKDLRKRIAATGWAWHVRDKSSGIEMLLVPQGSYRRGASEGDKDAKEPELPAHEILVTRAFYLGRFETQEDEWLHVMEGEPLLKKRGVPRTWINWPDVREFLQKANGEDNHLPLRLPTEAEWELACRAGSSGPRYDSKLKDIGWYAGNSGGRLHSVGELRANPLGFHDMLGNGSEWCADTWERRYYLALADGPAERLTDPFNGARAADWKHVLRGGAYDKDASLSRASFRQHGFPVPHKGPYVVRVARHP